MITNEKPSSRLVQTNFLKIKRERLRVKKLVLRVHTQRVLLKGLYHKASMGFKWQTLTKVSHGKPSFFVDSYKVAPIYISLQITTLQRPILIIKNAKNKCKGDPSQKEPSHLLVKIIMQLQFRTPSSRLPASCCDSPRDTASSSRRTRSTIWWK